MFKTIFSKTLYEKRWMIFWWTIGISVANVGLLLLFPPLRDALKIAMQNIPPSLNSLVGDSSQAFTSLKGYISLEIMGQMAAAVVVFSIILANVVLASEEKSGFLLTQLSRPLRRWSIYLQKYLAVVVALAVVMLGFWLSIWLGSVILKDTISLATLFVPCVAVFLLGLVFASLTFGISMALSSGTLAAIVVGSYGLIGYFMAQFKNSADILKTISHAFPFYYYNGQGVIADGLDLKNVLILLAFILVPIIVALPIFMKRDLKTR